MPAIGKVTYGAGTPYETEVQIEAEETGAGVTMTARVAKGVADLRGLFFDVGGTEIPYQTNTVGKKTVTVPFVDNTFEYSWARGLVSGGDVTETQWGEGLVADLGNGANVNGGFANPVTSAAIEDGSYDFGVEFGTQGIGTDDVGTTSFFLHGLTLDQLYDQAFAVRLTSTDDPLIEGPDREGSLKLTGIFNPPGDDDDQYTGFSHGYWKNHGPDANGNNENDWDVVGDPTFEAYFGLTKPDEWDWLTGTGQNQEGTADITFSQALALQGSGQNSLAREATAAVLNSMEEDVFYRFTTEQVIQWTKEAYDWTSGSLDTGFGSWNNQEEAILGLKDLFEEYNVREPQVVV